MENLNERLSPEGFKELYEFFINQNEQLIKAETIQDNLRRKYNFTSGKITGIIKRSEQQGLIIKTKRGIYKLNEEFINDSKLKEITVLEKVNNEIINTIDKIQLIIGKNITKIDKDDFEKIRIKIESLETIANK